MILYFGEKSVVSRICRMLLNDIGSLV